MLVNSSDGSGDLNVEYSTQENYNNTGRTLLKVEVPDVMLRREYEKIHDSSYSDEDYNKSNPDKELIVNLTYDMIYTWDSYRDYSNKLVNYAILDTHEDINDGEGTVQFHDNNPHQEEIDAFEEAIGEINKQSLLSAIGNKTLTGNTIGTTGFTKEVKSSSASTYNKLDNVKEGEEYSYKLRVQPVKGTSVENLIFYDSVETASDKGKDSAFSGKIKSIGTKQLEKKDVDVKVFVSKVYGLDITTNRELKAPTWEAYNGGSLEGVTAIAVDAQSKKDGSPFKLTDKESAVVYINMEAPTGNSAANIDTTDLAINKAYLNTTTTTGSVQGEANELLESSTTSLSLSKLKTTFNITAKKVLLDNDGKTKLPLQDGQFRFYLKRNGMIIDTALSKEDGTITFKNVPFTTLDRNATYTIKEDKGDDDTLVYDNSDKDITIESEINSDGDLIIKSISPKDITFTNAKKPDDTTLVVIYGVSQDNGKFKTLEEKTYKGTPRESHSDKEVGVKEFKGYKYKGSGTANGMDLAGTKEQALKAVDSDGNKDTKHQLIFPTELYRVIYFAYEEENKEPLVPYNPGGGDNPVTPKPAPEKPTPDKPVVVPDTPETPEAPETVEPEPSEPSTPTKEKVLVKKGDEIIEMPLDDVPKGYVPVKHYKDDGTEYIIYEEDIPVGVSTLPKTAGIPMPLHLVFGLLISAIGYLFKKH